MNPDLAVALTELINRAVHSTVGVVESGEAAELADMVRAASAVTAKAMGVLTSWPTAIAQWFSFQRLWSIQWGWFL